MALAFLSRVVCLFAVLIGSGFLPRAVEKIGLALRRYDVVGLTPVFLSAERRKKGDYEQYPDGLMDGKTCLVTGGNSGLGFATAVKLAEKGCAVTIASRRFLAVREACADIEDMVKRAKSKGSCTPMELNLASIKNVREFTSKFLEANPERLDVVVLNAGINQYWVTSDLEKSEDGVELQFAVNHLGHYAMMQDLSPLVAKTGDEHGDARVVVVSSAAHYHVPDDYDFNRLANINSEEHYNSWKWYAQSKLANVQMAYSLANKLRDNNVFVNVAAPGIVHTTSFPIRAAIADFIEKNPDFSGPGKYVLNFVDYLIALTGFLPEEGARTQFWLAASPDVARDFVRRRYFHPHLHEIRSHEQSYKTSSLTALSEKLLQGT
eukprot:CAMPEP_0184517010 /NCGR_PEP_ID=MMETSP0198_2-20121128/5334_1 /TAXON_ID=1112570 /ORGANISM="Thraustochytrium sp., Strain LLF1b" /LENGTH=377 /DNA_ID=CAMNT_0026907369 /DNA_START=79 /DNA_END=1212 /DNA_ORIENTATION=-